MKQKSWHLSTQKCRVFKRQDRAPPGITLGYFEDPGNALMTVAFIITLNMI